MLVLSAVGFEVLKVSIDSGFNDLQNDLDDLREARRHRDAFREGSGTAEDIIEIVPTGNLPRGTPKNPIHGVGVVVIVVRGIADRSRGEDPLR